MVDILSFVGDAPTWIASGAVILAAVQYKSEGRSRRAEADREAKLQASQLIAWAATCRTHDHDHEHDYEFGVVVSNTSGSTFHDVRIDATIHGKAVRRPIEMVILPPGRYWVPFNGPTQTFPWDFPQDFREHPGPLRPYMKTAEYLVNGMTFADNRNQRWSLNEYAVLTQQADEPEAQTFVATLPSAGRRPRTASQPRAFMPSADQS